MSDAKVIPLPGNELPLPYGEPVPCVVKELEQALSEARSGLIRAYALCRVVDDGTEGKLLFNDFFAAPACWRDLWMEFCRMQRRLEKVIDE